ncbi:MAG: asparagine synthase-related protein, partial [Cyanobacteria bacterium J06649_4]
MSAICGIVHRHGNPVATHTMAQIMKALEAYGPDGSGLWQEREAALGHQMLHLTPESLNETVPWKAETAGLVITADARLDNREELSTALAIAPQIGSTLSDSQLILQAYIKWGDQCPHRLLGDFSFAIWDARQQTLFCARDIFGIRPFFYHSSPTSFIFASDLNAILAAPEVSHTLNEPLLAAYLQQEDIMFAQKQLTFYDAIHKLPPAHYLTLTPSEQVLHRYWSPQDSPKIRLKSEADYAAMLQDLLDQAVRCRLRCAFPIGAHLSGGLDSSAVAVVAARALKSQGKTLQGFSWSPPITAPIDSAKDERTLVEEICKREDINGNYVTLTGQDYLNYRVRKFLSEPTEMLQCEQKVQTEVAAQKIRTVLSGWGGDEAITFNGRGYFAELFVTGRWRTLYRELKLRGKLHGLGLRGQIISKVIVPLLPDSLVTRLEAATNKYYQPAGESGYINPKLAKKVQSRQKHLPKLPYQLRERSGVRTNQQRLLDYGHLTNRIEAWAISGSQHQLVYSYPLLDRRIVEFALGIPVDLFFKHGWKRYLFRSS